jgi:hypothetical protein
VAPHLTLPEQVEVDNQECADQKEQSTEEIQAVDRPAADRNLDASDQAAHRPPLPEQQQWQVRGRTFGS